MDTQTPDEITFMVQGIKRDSGSLRSRAPVRTRVPWPHLVLSLLAAKRLLQEEAAPRARQAGSKAARAGSSGSLV